MAKAEWIDHLVDLKVATSFSHSHFSAQILYKALTDGGYRKHMEQLKIKLSESMRITIEMLEKLEIKPWVIPKAGIFLWCELPANVDIKKMADDCNENGVILALGNSFSQSDRFQQFLRFNVAQCMHPDIFAILEKAMNNARS